MDRLKRALTSIGKSTRGPRSTPRAAADEPWRRIPLQKATPGRLGFVVALNYKNHWLAVRGIPALKSSGDPPLPGRQSDLLGRGRHEGVAVGGDARFPGGALIGRLGGFGTCPDQGKIRDEVGDARRRKSFAAISADRTNDLLADDEPAVRKAGSRPSTDRPMSSLWSQWGGCGGKLLAGGDMWMRAAHRDCRSHEPIGRRRFGARIWGGPIAYPSGRVIASTPLLGFPPTPSCEINRSI